MAKIFQLGAMARALGQRISKPQGGTISGVSPDNWPTALQPVAPIGPPGSQPLAFPMMMGQNQVFTPKFDAAWTSADLRFLGTYPLARICIENTKDQLSQLAWKIQLRRMPGESDDDLKSRRRVEHKGDPMINMLYKFFEMPDQEHVWPDWIRPVVEDMMAVDAVSILPMKTFSGKLVGFESVPGDNICRYVDDTGRTPRAPDPAYAQLWNGIPRVNLSTDELLYRPRNIVPRNSISSYLYGFSPVEQVASEIQIGLARLTFVKNYYDTGSMPNMIQVVPPGVTSETMKETMQWINSELAGNLETRRQFRLIQGFQRDGKHDQVLFPKEPVLADVFDDLHIRKLCFAFGASPQRLMRMMNRASAQVSQNASEEEGIRPWADWLCRAVINQMIWILCNGDRRYEMVMNLRHEADMLKKSKVDSARIDGGQATINEVRLENGQEPNSDPAADELAITTPTGRIPIGTPVMRGDDTPAKPAGPKKPAAKPKEGD